MVAILYFLALPQWAAAVAEAETPQDKMVDVAVVPEVRAAPQALPQQAKVMLVLVQLVIVEVQVVVQVQLEL
jgi:hypothetical protein